MPLFTQTKRVSLKKLLKKLGSKVKIEDDIEVNLDYFTITQGYWAVRKKDGRTIGITDGKKIYLVDTKVELRANADGYIAPGITNEGIGTIEKVRINGHACYRVRMDKDKKQAGYVDFHNVWREIAE